MKQVRKYVIRLLLPVSVGLSMAGCLPQPPTDDNGTISFVRQAVPKLLGRKPKGADEVELLADIGSLLGREAVIRLLMEQPEFVSHWTDVLVGHLRLQREGERAQPARCFGDPLLPYVTSALANFVTNNPPQSAFSAFTSFNMTDIIGSAILADDLSSIYRAYPLPLAARPGLDPRFAVPRSAVPGQRRGCVQ